MRDREAVVDIEVAERRQLARERRIVLFLAGMEARVFEQQHIARIELGDRGLGGLADAIVRERDRAADGARHLGGERPERFLVVAALRPAEMRNEDHLAALAGDLVDGRRHALDAGDVGDLAVLHRRVEVDAQEHAFAVDVDVVEGAEAMAFATSCPGRASQRRSAVRAYATAQARLRLRCTADPRPPQAGRSSGPSSARHFVRASAPRTRPVRSISPSPRPCRPCGWRSPTHCRTRTSPARTCRPSPWSGPCGTPTSADRG